MTVRLFGSIQWPFERHVYPQTENRWQSYELNLSGWGVSTGWSFGTKVAMSFVNWPCKVHSSTETTLLSTNYSEGQKRFQLITRIGFFLAWSPSLLFIREKKWYTKNDKLRTYCAFWLLRIAASTVKSQLEKRDRMFSTIKGYNNRTTALGFGGWMYPQVSPERSDGYRNCQ